jgi:hypothetical protein
MVKQLPSRIRTRLTSPKPWSVAGVLVASALLGALVLDYTRLRRDQDLLADRLNRLEARGFSREEIQTHLARELAETRATVSNLVQERSLGRGLLEKHADEICLVHVAYRYVDARTSAPMTLARPGQGGSVVLEHDVFGTAFPVAPAVLLSNRHVLEPWWQSPEAETKEREGFVPQRIAMRAFCPAVDEPLAIEMLGVSPDADLATARLTRGRLEPVPVAPPERELRSGFSVFLLGYPTGLDAALARAPERDRRSLLPLLRQNPSAVADSLLQRGLLQPLLTYGRISDAHPERITFDAPTARGGSGGPLFNRHGEVIGVSSEILPGFAGANFAIPLRTENPLLVQR